MRHASIVRRIPPVATSVVLLNLLAGGPAAAAVLDVPAAFPTIQSAINAASNGDTVRVAPGVYSELIDFLGKNIVVESTSGAAVTTIDGDDAGTVVTIDAAAGETPTLRGFTITGGYSTGIGGGGMLLFGGPALVEGNIIAGNAGCPGGIAASFSTATIRNNVISDNRPNCSGGTGGGINIGGDGAVQFLNNLVARNLSGFDGHGVSLFAAGSPVISGNIIIDNGSPAAGGSGGGIVIYNASNALISNNVIARNHAFSGGGIFWLVPSGQRGPIVINNTLIDNVAIQGSGVFADGFDERTVFKNNIVVGSGTAALFECGAFNDMNPPVITFNDVFHADGGFEYAGICLDQTGVNGNISVDPLFVVAPGGDFHLQPGSPVIDLGDGARAPDADIDGDTRPADGNGDGVRQVDMGADEVTLGGEDTTPPTIACSVNPAMMWPPNHKMRSVVVAIDANDDSGSAFVTLVSVASDQPASAAGDIQGWAIGSDDRSGLLRAERSFDTRHYTLVYEARDSSDNLASCTVTVTVPHSQGRGK